MKKLLSLTIILFLLSSTLFSQKIFKVIKENDFEKLEKMLAKGIDYNLKMDSPDAIEGIAERPFGLIEIKS